MQGRRGRDGQVMSKSSQNGDALCKGLSHSLHDKKLERSLENKLETVAHGSISQNSQYIN
jgi:hypothetical protein